MPRLKPTSGGGGEKVMVFETAIQLAYQTQVQENRDDMGREPLQQIEKERHATESNKELANSPPLFSFASNKAKARIAGPRVIIGTATRVDTSRYSKTKGPCKQRSSVVTTETDRHTR